MALQPFSKEEDLWECSNCFHSHINHATDRNNIPCQKCGLLDSDRNRRLANGFYQFGIIEKPSIHLLPQDTPFFIYPLTAPKITYYFKKEDAEELIIRFEVDLFDTQKTTKYHVSKIKINLEGPTEYTPFILKDSDRPKPNVFETTLIQPCHGTYDVCIEAMIEYRIGFIDYTKMSPTTNFTIEIERTTPFHHECELEKYILSSSEVKESDVDIDDENYYEPQLIELNADDDECLSVYVQFLESAHMQMSQMENIFVYKIENRHLEDAYKSKQKQMLKILNNDKSKLNEKVLYHGTSLDVVLKILHQGFLRQFTSRAVYGQGVYFARGAWYSCSPRYAKPDDDSFQHVLVCNVNCGEWCIGRSSMKIPLPKSEDNEYLTYETTVDKLDNPSIFVTYMDYQALPKYLVSFKLKPKD